MCFDDNRRDRRVDLICECREVRSDRDDRHHHHHDHHDHHDHHHCDRHRDDEFKCRCRSNRRRRNFWW